MCREVVRCPCDSQGLVRGLYDGQADVIFLDIGLNWKKHPTYDLMQEFEKR